MSVFAGLSAFPITPVRDTGALDEDALGRIVERLCRPGVASLGLLGSTGAYPFHDPALRMRAVRVALEAVAGRMPVIVGVGALRTDDAVALARDAGAAGADALLLAPVSYTPLRDAEVFGLYRDVADAVDLPLCIYNNPGTTHFTFSDALLARIAEMPSVGAVKMPLPPGDMGDDLARLRVLLPEDFTIGYSGDWGCGDALRAGADGFFSALAGILPGPFVEMARDADRAGKLEARLGLLIALTQEWGSLRVAHAIAQIEGVAAAPLPRPLMPLDDHAMAAVERALEGLPS